MSLAELLPAIRSLPAGEKVQLMHLLVDELGAPNSVDNEIPEHLRHLIPPPGTVAEVWSPTTDAAGMQVIQQALDELKKERP